MDIDGIAVRAFALLPRAALEAICPFHDRAGHFPAEAIRSLRAVRDAAESPCSMRADSEAELLAHETVALAVAYAHDEIAQRDGWTGFPEWYCGRASTGVMLSLLAHGYANALVLRAGAPRDHSYVGLPYSGTVGAGVVIVDPTFGQMSDARVLITRRDGVLWEYRPGWRSGIDLYPNMVLDRERLRRFLAAARMTALYAMPRPGPVVGSQYADMPTYLAAAQANPIEAGILPPLDEILKNLRSALRRDGDAPG